MKVWSRPGDDTKDSLNLNMNRRDRIIRRQCHNALKVDELFLNNISLADDRSVAHYNLEDGSILETTSNPFWVSCLYIKASEIKQEREGNPDDDVIQRWTNQSLPKKYTLIGILLNSKNEKTGQPPHFPTLDDFLIHLERLDKKGANMHPDYTQRDMRAFEREYREEFLGRYDDPLAAFIDHHAVRLGHLLPDEIEQRPMLRQAVVPRHVEARGRNMAATGAGRPRAGGRKKQERYCEDCEEAMAEVYCTECQGGLAMCRRCSNLLHAGASRRRHQLQDIEQAPNNNNAKPYVPRAFLAPFAIVLAMFSALNKGRLSLNEREIKAGAQPLTDTDLQDKQIGKWVGGFDCMENVLIMKGLVKKEASRTPSYALTATGQVLGERLYIFYTTFYKFLDNCRLPKVSNIVSNSIVNNRKLCLIIDENERDKDRLLRLAAEKNVDAQVRLLPAGDYVWILSPPMMDPHSTYTGRDSGNELVLPFVVERKSWEDFEHSVNSKRFLRQVNSMLGCGIQNCFYLMEGSVTGLRGNSTHHQQHRLKALLEQLTTENGFYVNYTSSWMKSAQWLLWFTGLVGDGLNMGIFQDLCIPYGDYMSRVARQRGSTNQNAAFRNADRHTHIWRAQNFIDNIIRNGQGERPMLTTVREDLGVNNRGSRHMVVIQDLEQYNKKRQSTLNKCCEAVHANPDQARVIVEDKIGQVVHNMVHYDVASYWQLYIQVMTGVYVVRTENLQDSEKIQRIFLSKAPGIPVIQPPTPAANKAPETKKPARSKKTVRKPTATVTKPIGHGHAVDDPDDLDLESVLPVMNRNLQLRNARIRMLNGDNETQNISDQENGSGQTFAGHVIKTGRRRNISKDDLGDDKGQGHNGAKVSDIKPFSGQGFSLGSGTGNENPYFVNNGLGSNKRQENDTRLKGQCQNKSRSTGLIGGMWNGDQDERREDDDGIEHYPDYKMEYPHAEETLKPEDFIDSQNEDYIMSQVIAQSVTEAKPVSNEDEMIRLAMEMSRQESVKTQAIDTARASENITEEEQIELAIQRSRLDSREQAKNWSQSETNSSQNDVSVLRQIRNEKDFGTEKNVGRHTGFKDRGDISKKEFGKADYETATLRNGITGNIKNRNIRDPVKSGKKEVKGDQDIGGIPSDEEEQLRIAIELSKTDTPKKSDIVVIDDENEIGYKNYSSKKFRSPTRKARKRRHVDEDVEIVEEIPNERNGKTAKKIETNLNNLSEEDHLKLAMELSLSQVPQTNSDNDVDDIINVDDDIDEEKVICHIERENIVNKEVETTNKLSEDEELRLVIEKSKTDHSPVKKVKLDGKDEYVDENELIQIAINRSRLEHTPKKKARKGERMSGSGKCSRDDDVERKYGDSRNENIEVIEINSQNSQEFDDPFNTVKKMKIEEKSNELNNNRSESPKFCNVSTGRKVECDQSSGGVNIDNADELDHDSEDNDFVGPSPRKEGNMELSISHSFSAKTPVSSQSSIKQLSAKMCSNVCGDANNTREIERNCDSVNSDRPEDQERSSGMSVSRNISANFGHGSKGRDFDLKASLFYNSDEESESEHDERSASESEEDIFDDSVEHDRKDKNVDSGQGAVCDKVGKELDDSGSAVSCQIDKSLKGVKSGLASDSIECMQGCDRQADDAVHKQTHKNSTVVVMEKSKECKKMPDKAMDVVKGHNDDCLLTTIKTEKDDVSYTEISDIQRFPNEPAAKDNLISANEIKQEIGNQEKTTNESYSNIITAVKEELLSDEEAQENDEDFDDDYDLDYQPSTQDLKENNESNDDGDDMDDLDNNEADLNRASQESSLPVINRPRSIRYREMKRQSDLLLEQMKNQMNKTTEKGDDYIGGSMTIKKEVDDEAANNSVTDMDEKLAQMMQQEFDREAKQAESERTLIDDAYIARQLQESLNKETNVSTAPIDQSDKYAQNEPRSSDTNKCNERLTSKDNGSKNDRSISTKSEGVKDSESCRKVNTNVTSVNTNYGQPDPVVLELQRRELEKIERWRKLMVDDEKFAKQLEEIQTSGEESDDKKSNINSCSKRSESSGTSPSFKTLVAQHKQSKEKALAQLQEYRNLQMRRFETSQTSVSRGGYHRTVSGGDNIRPVTKTPGRNATATIGSGNNGMSLDGRHDQKVINQTSNNRTNNFLDDPLLDLIGDRDTQLPNKRGDTYPTQPKIDPYPRERMYPNERADTSLNQPQRNPFPNVQPNISQRDNFIPDEADQEDDHMTQTDQSQCSTQSVKNSNITCGNCGGKGHNRTFPRCPRYHTAEESARREAKQEKSKQQREEKKKQEADTINMLSEHKQVLEDMTSQIQREMHTIQRRLQQRASELESQVTSRVKKIEGAKKKKK